MNTYAFPDFTIEYNPETGAVTTKYPDGTYCPVQVNPDHEYHGNLLYISGGEYNLLHELAHHVVGKAMGNKTCPIVWASAHQLPMPHNAQLLEWYITALSYFTLNTSMRDPKEWGAIQDLAKVSDVYRLRKKLLRVYKILKFRSI